MPSHAYDQLLMQSPPATGLQVTICAPWLFPEAEVVKVPTLVLNVLCLPLSWVYRDIQ